MKRNFYPLVKLVIIIANFIFVFPLNAETKNVTINATDLYSEYMANSIAADQKYKNNKITVTGIVSKIDKNITNEAYVQFTSNSNGNVQCNMKSVDQVLNIRPGDRIEAEGICLGKKLFIMVLVDKCNIINNSKDSNSPNEVGSRKDVPVPEEMVLIPEGTFMMGSNDEYAADERPVHKLTISSFYMDKTEVTQKEYEMVMGNNPSDFKNCPDCPVENVSWYDANTYCEKVGKRLPTEAEWEYAARAGSNTKYYWGDTIDGDYTWYEKNSGKKTNPVATKKPNAWGLYDMIGNVCEWCSDWYDGYYYNPTHPKIHRVHRRGDPALFVEARGPTIPQISVLQIAIGTQPQPVFTITGYGVFVSRIKVLQFGLTVQAMAILHHIFAFAKASQSLHACNKRYFNSLTIPYM